MKLISSKTPHAVSHSLVVEHELMQSESILYLLIDAVSIILINTCTCTEKPQNRIEGGNLRQIYDKVKQMKGNDIIIKLD